MLFFDDAAPVIVLWVQMIFSMLQEDLFSETAACDVFLCVVLLSFCCLISETEILVTHNVFSEPFAVFISLDLVELTSSCEVLSETVATLGLGTFNKL